MLNDRNDLLQSDLNNLKNSLIIELELDNESFLKFIDNQIIPEGKSEFQKEFLILCMDFYNNVKLNMNGEMLILESQQDSFSSYQRISDGLPGNSNPAPDFIKIIKNFNSKLDNLRKKSLQYDFRGGIGIFFGYLFLGIPFLFKSYNNFFFPPTPLQNAIDKIKKLLEIDIDGSWANKTAGHIQLPIKKCDKDEVSPLIGHTHQGLIKFGQKLGYSSTDEGICQGYTMRWIEATILKQQPKFLNRIDKIMELNRLIDQGQTLEELCQHPKWKDVLWDIKAFYESLYLYQGSNMMSSILDKTLIQDDIDTISEIASSDEIKEIGGIKKSPTLRYDEFSKDGLLLTLRKLEQKIVKSLSQEPACFLLQCSSDRGLHAINVTYDPTDHSWQWVDVNLPYKLKFTKLERLLGNLDNIKIGEPTNKKYLEFDRSFSISAVLPKVNSEIFEKSLKEVTIFEDKYNPFVNQSILFQAVKNGDLDVVQELLKNEGIDLNQANTNGTTPLLLAVAYGHLGVVKELLKKEGIDLNQANTNGTTPLLLAAVKGNLSVVKELLKKKGINLNQATTDGETPLLIAAAKGDLGVVKELLKKEGIINLNQATTSGVTPLFIAAENGHLDVVIELLNKDGIAPNQATTSGVTPLYIAAQNGKEEIVRYLLEKGDDWTKTLKLSVASLNDFADQAKNDPPLKERINKIIKEYQQKNPGVKTIEITPEQIAFIMDNVNVKNVFTEYFYSKVVNAAEKDDIKTPRI